MSDTEWEVKKTKKNSFFFFNKWKHQKGKTTTTTITWVSMGFLYFAVTFLIIFIFHPQFINEIETCTLKINNFDLCCWLLVLVDNVSNDDGYHCKFFFCLRLVLFFSLLNYDIRFVEKVLDYFFCGFILDSVLNNYEILYFVELFYMIQWLYSI